MKSKLRRCSGEFLVCLLVVFLDMVQWCGIVHRTVHAAPFTLSLPHFDHPLWRTLCEMSLSQPFELNCSSLITHAVPSLMQSWWRKIGREKEVSVFSNREKLCMSDIYKQLHIPFGFKLCCFLGQTFPCRYVACRRRIIECLVNCYLTCYQTCS